MNVIITLLKVYNVCRKKRKTIKYIFSQLFSYFEKLVQLGNINTIYDCH